MSIVLHLSDTHFGTERQPVAAALLRLAEKIRPDLALLSGDVTQRARRTQFAKAKRFIDALPVPVTLVIPGNHDIPLFNLPARIFSPYGNYRHAFGNVLEPAYSDAGLLVQCVNTTRPWRRKDGEVSHAQVAAVAQQLRRAERRQLRIVVVHQPLLVIRDSDSANLLHGHREAAKAWAAAGVDLILSGHIHIPYIRTLHGMLTEVTQPAWVVSAGTAVSKRVREGKPNSVNVIRYEPSQQPRACVIERLDFHSGTTEFVVAESTRLTLA